AEQILDEEQLAFLVDPGVPDGQAIQTVIPNNACNTPKLGRSGIMSGSVTS
ncbi:hypothetical protein Tco_0577281, partial [Tanacetum coccineum]